MRAEGGNLKTEWNDRRSQTAATTSLKSQTHPSSLDRSPWWLRLLRSLRISIKPGKSWKRPVGYIGVTGKVDF